MTKHSSMGIGRVAERGSGKAYRACGDDDGSLMPLAEDFERLFQDLVEGSLQGIMVTQGEKLVFANRALAEMLGYTVQDLVALRSWEQLLAPRERKRVAAFCRARADYQPAPDRYEYEALRKDGSSIWLENLSRTVNWNDKPATQATVVDITKRKRAEDALRESEARYRTLAEFVSEAVFIHDGVEIVETNKAAERMYGYTREEMIGMPINLLVAPESRDMVADFIARQSETVYEGVALRKDGSTFEAEIQPRLIEYQGRMHRFVAARDISARKAVERMKDELISVISHELRTPLTSIRGSLGLTLGGALGEMPDGAKNMIDLALRNTDRLSHLVDHILDLEKAAAGRLELKRDHIDLGVVVRQAIESNAGMGDEMNVAFALDPIPDCLPVKIDAEKVSQVVANLLTNAAKFSPYGGEVRITVDRNGTAARVSVLDDGPGVPEAFRGRIFEKFSQADATDARNVSGSGLGLYICKAIIEQHGGSIGFENRSGGGAAFHFDLPLHEG